MFNSSFFLFSRNGKNKEQAKRTQIPLVLCWAMTIHKAQGQTLNEVNVDMKYMFAEGHAYVGLTRTQHGKNLVVRNFSATKCVPCPLEARKFANTNGKPPKCDMQCCHYSVAQNPAFLHGVEDHNYRENGDSDDEGDTGDDGNNDDDDGNDDDDDDGGDDNRGDEHDDCVMNDDNKSNHNDHDTDEIVEEIDDKVTFALNDLTITENNKYKPKNRFESNLVNEILQNITHKVNESGNEAAANVLQSIKGNPKYEKTINIFWNVCDKILHDTTTHTVKKSKSTTTEYNTKTMTNFQMQTTAYLQSSKYKQLVGVLFEVEKPSSLQLTVTADTFLQVRSKVLQKVAAEKRNNTLNNITETKPKEITSGGEEHIRYLGGRAVHQTSKMIKRSLTTVLNKGEPGGCTYTKHQLTTSLKQSEQTVLTNTKVPETLQYTINQQLPGKHLTHIADNTHQFFVTLESQRRSTTTVQSLIRQRGNILNHVSDSCLHDLTLLELFLSLIIPVAVDIRSSEAQSISTSETVTAVVNDLTDYTDAIIDIYDSLISSYLEPPSNDFRKTLSTTLGKKRKLFHRANILIQEPPTLSVQGTVEKAQKYADEVKKSKSAKRKKKNEKSKVTKQTQEASKHHKVKQIKKSEKTKEIQEAKPLKRPQESKESTNSIKRAKPTKSNSTQKKQSKQNSKKRSQTVKKK